MISELRRGRDAGSGGAVRWILDNDGRAGGRSSGRDCDLDDSVQQFIGGAQLADVRGVDLVFWEPVGVCEGPNDRWPPVPPFVGAGVEEASYRERAARESDHDDFPPARQGQFKDAGEKGIIQKVVLSAPPLSRRHCQFGRLRTRTGSLGGM